MFKGVIKVFLGSMSNSEFVSSSVVIERVRIIRVFLFFIKFRLIKSVMKEAIIDPLSEPVALFSRLDQFESISEHFFYSHIALISDRILGLSK